jgi:hypothetical protein
MRRSLLTLALLASASAHAAAPQINVGALFDYMEPGKSQLLKRVRNSGDATAYVRVEITRMHYDAAGNVTETPVDAAALARSASGVNGLIASPARMIIPANNGQQATRLVYRGARDSEQYYRVRYVPVVPDEGEFSLDEQQAAQYKEGVQAGVNVFTGYGTVVFVPPGNAHFDTRIEGQQITNHGNATIVLDNLKQCLRAKPDECSGGIKVHVFPGKSHTLAQDADHYSRYELREGTASRTVDTRN